MKKVESIKPDMAIQKQSVEGLAEYFARNIDTVNLTGLYNGKAGLSLSLFVASKYLQDERLEDIAYRLIREALVIKNNDLGFENGLAGIGYALLFLIENNYLEADFDEVFGAQYKEIIGFFENIDKHPSHLINLFPVIYFISTVSRIKNDSRIQLIIKKFFEGLELFLIIHFQDFYDLHYIGIKTDVLHIYKTYLRLVDYSGYGYFSRCVMDDYAALYRKGKAVSSLETGYYLQMITNKYHISGYEDVINDHIVYGTKTIFPNTLSLRERIDAAKLMYRLQIKGLKDVDSFLEMKSMRKETAIRNLLKTVDEKYNPLGYGYGLARLLIYYADGNMEML